MSAAAVRPATEADLEAMVEIYNHYVSASHCTFDVEPFSRSQRLDWWRQFDGKRLRCLVAVQRGRVLGYACSTPLKPKPAYQTSVEVSVYLHPEHTGKGLGRRLYEPLLDTLSGQDVHRAYALVAQPNEPSMRLHDKLGFRKVAELNEVGRKFGKYWDVVWLEARLPR